MKKPAKIIKLSKLPGSQVSVSVLIDYIREGYSLAEFLSDYPWIKQEKVQKTLDALKKENFPQKYAF